MMTMKIFLLSLKLVGVSDPLVPLENLFKKIFLCGIFDALQETFYGKPEEECLESTGTQKDTRSDLKNY